jgi:beta-carotene ketolase (CrtW type)
VGPALLSTLQLFVFGTWLPHRPHADAPFADRHRARSQRWPTWLSLLTCYHFGYHWEHHAHPHVPWWRLPATVQNTMPPTPPVEV